MVIDGLLVQHQVGSWFLLRSFPPFLLPWLLTLALSQCCVSDSRSFNYPPRRTTISGFSNFYLFRSSPFRFSRFRRKLSDTFFLFISLLFPHIFLSLYSSVYQAVYSIIRPRSLFPQRSYFLPLCLEFPEKIPLVRPTSPVPSLSGNDPHSLLSRPSTSIPLPSSARSNNRTPRFPPKSHPPSIQFQRGAPSPPPFLRASGASSPSRGKKVGQRTLFSINFSIN